MVKQPPFNVLAELPPVLMEAGKVEVRLVPLQLLESVGGHIAGGKIGKVRTSTKLDQFSMSQLRKLCLVGIQTVHQANSSVLLEEPSS